MRSYSALFAAFLILLLAAPAGPVAAGTTPSAGPDAPPVTFNLVRLALYPTTRTYDAVAAVNNHAFLADNHYDSTIPPDSCRNSKCRLPGRGVSGARDVPSRRTRLGAGRVRCDRAA